MDHLEYVGVAEQLAEDFTERPFDYVTESDLQARLVHLLRRKLIDKAALGATVDDHHLDVDGSHRSYKQAYKQAIEESLREHSTMNRVHTEVSVAQGKRYDVVVFKDTITQIKWVRSGSKRYNKQDLDAVFELKYVKNRCYFPTKCHINSPEILDTDIDILKHELDLEKNKIKQDLNDLNDLPKRVETYLLIFSNNNYLFKQPLTEPEKNEKTKAKIGKAAQTYLRENAEDTTILYAHPLGYTELTK